ncbi:DUF1830 domain-containing protein [Nostoc sp. MS1]|uniref:DUF1830 domain-containing protein n=1 Tax=Nostoc sp. MS1 TaxID=2764711 RepID=UPI001CC6650A|nr:DUF1830 domain-containing protein [Nostoc sp. MS1]BCL36788.1 hypothetical protein NSMS1_32350 [Nostoc sp. MS1]
MAQILDPLPPEQSGKVLCCYVNATSKIQVARITNIPNWYFERVVFPGQRLVFEAPIEGQMEIHTGMMASAILSDTIPCDRLLMDEPSNSEFNTDSVVTDPISTKSISQTNNTKPLTVAHLASVE